MNKKLLTVTAMFAFASLTSTTTFANSDNTTLNYNTKPTNSVLQQTKEAVSDSSIIATVKAKLARNKLLSVFNISVKTAEGNVQLSGKVDSDMQYEEAVMLAQSTNGVKDVDAEHLMVKDSNQPIEDTYITAKIKGQLLKDKMMGKNVQSWPVSVETKNGVVFLKGKVDSDAQKENIERAIKDVDGVKSVRSYISVKQDNEENVE